MTSKGRDSITAGQKYSGLSATCYLWESTAFSTSSDWILKLYGPRGFRPAV